MLHLLIVLFVTFPFSFPTNVLPDKGSPSAWKALKDVALVAEVAGPQGPWVGNFQTEMAWVRRSMFYCHDYPSLDHLERLPDLEECKWGREKTQEMICYMRDLMETRIHHAEETRDLFDWVVTANRFYDEAKLAQSEPLLCHRRDHLHYIKNMVGEKVWKEGKWPILIR